MQRWLKASCSTIAIRKHMVTNELSTAETVNYVKVPSFIHKDDFAINDG